MVIVTAHRVADLRVPRVVEMIVGIVQQQLLHAVGSLATGKLNIHSNLL